MLEKLPRLYVATDEKVLPNHLLLEKVEEVLAAGVRLIQLRFKQTPADEQEKLGAEVRALTKEYNALLIVNDSPELALEIRADGVHLGADDPHVDEARTTLGADAIIGVSAYGEICEVERWNPAAVSYIGLLSPYPSSTKEKDNVDITSFKKLVARAKVPLYAIGGVTPARVGELMKAGCYGVAVVSAVFGADNPGQAVKIFLKEIERFSEV